MPACRRVGGGPVTDPSSTPSLLVQCQQMSVTVSTAALSSPYGWMGAQNLCCQIYASGGSGSDSGASGKSSGTSKSKGKGKKGTSKGYYM